jgi:hypothetical protein
VQQYCILDAFPGRWQQYVTNEATVNAVRILPWYYAATVLFLLLDYVLGINVRVAFLEPWPGARVAYYLVCFACFALMVWRPAWTTLIGTFESLVTLVALILGTAIRVMVPTDAIFGENAAFVTVPEILNFLISGSMAYLAWVNGLKQLRGL